MTVYRLEPAGPGVCASINEALGRMASIVRKYATTRVAVTASAVEATIPPGTLHCDPPEAARRIAIIAGSWTGTRVDVAPVVETPDAPLMAPPQSLEPWSVAIAGRDEAPGELRRRVARAAQRLEVMLEAHGAAPARWVLHLDRDGAEVHMPLPAQAFLDSEDGLARRLPDRALAAVSGARLEARTNHGANEMPRSRAHPRDTQAPVLPLVS